jgi:hypothetical protein
VSELKATICDLGEVVNKDCVTESLDFILMLEVELGLDLVEYTGEGGNPSIGLSNRRVPGL